jgi:hypothetical protein
MATGKRGRDPNQPLDVEPVDDDADSPSRLFSTGGREQEQSIRDRKSLMFDDEELPDTAAAAAGAAPIVSKTFQEYLAITPPAPLSSGMKAALYATGAVVLLLLVAALLKQG